VAVGWSGIRTPPLTCADCPRCACICVCPLRACAPLPFCSASPARGWRRFKPANVGLTPKEAENPRGWKRSAAPQRALACHSRREGRSVSHCSLLRVPVRCQGGLPTCAPFCLLAVPPRSFSSLSKCLLGPSPLCPVNQPRAWARGELQPFPPRSLLCPYSPRGLPFPMLRFSCP
jgi:hypothetical protein